METPANRWDVERAAGWLRRHAWGEGGEASAPALDQEVVAEAEAQAGQASELPEEDQIDIASWPPLVAPFYD